VKSARRENRVSGSTACKIARIVEIRREEDKLRHSGKRLRFSGTDGAR
jgi:hypothetical protein